MNNEEALEVARFACDELLKRIQPVLDEMAVRVATAEQALRDALAERDTFLYICHTCEHQPFAGIVPVCPLCLGSNVAVMTEDGAPIRRYSPRGVELSAMMHLDD